MRRAAALLAALAILLPAHAADGELRAWPVPGRGKLEMIVPTDWYDDPRGPQGAALPRVRFFDRLGPRPPFDMTVTIAWSTGKEASYKDPARLRAFVAQSADDLAAGTVEKRFPLREIAGENGVGYYFRATIQSPVRRRVAQSHAGRIRGRGPAPRLQHPHPGPQVAGYRAGDRDAAHRPPRAVVPTQQKFRGHVTALSHGLINLQRQVLAGRTSTGAGGSSWNARSRWPIASTRRCSTRSIRVP